MNKLVFITSRFPYPLDKGDKLRVFFQLQHLAKTYEVHLFAINTTSVKQEDLNLLKGICASVQVFIIPLHKRLVSLALSPIKSLPLQVAFFYNKSTHKQIVEKIKAINPNHIHCHLIRTTELVKGLEGINKSLDFMDAFGLGMEKREQFTSNPFKRLLFSYEKRMLYAYESRVFNFIDHFCIISEQDKAHIKHEKADKIKIIPNGVDFDVFHPKKENKSFDLLFMGNLGYPPNVEAMLFLIHKIMPLVWNRNNDIKLLLAGIGAPNKIKELVSDKIFLIEKYEDISISIAQSRIMVAPMQISIGLQNKIIQAMAMKVPCVVSSSSNKAIKAPNGEAILEADKPIEFADAIIHLMEHPVIYEELAERGFQFVHENFSWVQQNDLMIQLFNHPIEK